MKYFISFILVFVVHFSMFNVNAEVNDSDAANNNVDNADLDDQNRAEMEDADRERVRSEELKTEKILEEYKRYVGSISPEVREEIVNYRKEMAKLNNRKKELYKRLSNAAQNYLKQQRAYKKKLPLKSIKKVEKEVVNK